jgi:hypothetical protein
MSNKIFDLKDVPAAEANSIRRLLDQADIEFYETPSTLLSGGAIWVHEASDIPHARALIQDFETEWKGDALASNSKAGKMPWMEIFANVVLWLLIAVVLLSIFGHFVT